MKKPDAILIGDIHARDDQPPCRLDNFLDTQEEKFSWFYGLWIEYNQPPIICSGDVFHKWKSSPWIIRKVMEMLPPMITVPGNHDLPNHSLDMYWKSSLAVVESSGLGWEVLRGVTTDSEIEIAKHSVVPYPWGYPILAAPSAPVKPNNKRIAIIHSMVLDSKVPFEGEEALTLLKRLYGYNLIVTGHNHKPFVVRHEGRLLVNPGSFTRQTADETHEPRVYLWYAKENRVEPVFIPIKEGVITREHIEVQKDRDDRLTAFVEKLSGEDRSITVSFKDNLLQALSNPEIRESVRTRVMEAIDE